MSTQTEIPWSYDGDYSSADFETGVSDESMDAAIDWDSTDFSEDFSD